MTETIQTPFRGQKPRAEWAAAVTDGLNRLGMMGPSRMLVRESAGGCGFEPIPANNRWHAIGASLSPFAVRKVEANDDAGIPYTGWEIYLPSGCAALSDTCLPLNPKAEREDADGNTYNPVGWHVLSVDGDPSDDDWFEVYVHLKPLAGVSGVDEFEDYPKSYLWAEMHKMGEPFPDYSRAGDAMCVKVGVVHFENVTVGDETKLVGKYTHSLKYPVHAAYAKAEEFQLWSAFKPVELEGGNCQLELEKIYLRNPTFSAAGTTFSSSGLAEIEPDAKSVYLKIETATNPPTAEIMSFEDDATDGGSSAIEQVAQAQSELTDTNLFILLYSLDNGFVVGDNRKSAMNIQIYK